MNIRIWQDSAFAVTSSAGLTKGRCNSSTKGQTSSLLLQVLYIFIIVLMIQS